MAYNFYARLEEEEEGSPHPSGVYVELVEEKLKDKLLTYFHILLLEEDCYGKSIHLIEGIEEVEPSGRFIFKMEGDRLLISLINERGKMAGLVQLTLTEEVTVSGFIEMEKL